MSSPGVIRLAQINIGDYILRIEDNIGEAIHIHFGYIRLDVSIAEYSELVESLIKIAEKMINVKNFFFHSFDAIWLSQEAYLLLKLRKLEFKKEQVGTLLTNQYDEDGQIIINVRESRVSKAINGDLAEISEWKQKNYIFEDNISRMKNIYESIKENGYYPESKGTYITLCDNGKFIVDGCHRASAIYNLYGNIEILVANWITENYEFSDEHRERRLKSERKNFLLAKKREMNIKEFRKIQVLYLITKDLSGKQIIIKGAGEHTKEFVELCGDKVNIIGIFAKEIIIDSLKKFPKIEEKNLLDINADMIFISSYRYRWEMKAELEPYENKFEIYDLYDRGIDKQFF